MTAPRRGAVLGGCLSWVVVLGVLGYVTVHVGRPYYRFYRFKDAVEQQARFAQARTDDAIERDIWAAADSLGLPESAYHVRIVRDAWSIHITDQYDDSWSLPGYERSVRFTLDSRTNL